MGATHLALSAVHYLRPLLAAMVAHLREACLDHLIFMTMRATKPASYQDAKNHNPIILPSPCQLTIEFFSIVSQVHGHDMPGHDMPDRSWPLAAWALRGWRIFGRNLCGQFSARPGDR